MDLLNQIPIVGCFLGIFLLFLLFSSKKGQFKNRKAKYCLASILLINTHLQFDSYLFFNGYENSSFFGLSFYFYHLSGALLYLYTLFLFKSEIKRTWILLFLIYSVFHIVITTYELLIDEIKAPYNVMDILSGLNYYVNIILNFSLVLLAYLRVKKIKFSVDLSSEERINYNWIKNLLFISVILFLATLQSNIMLLFEASEWLKYVKFETLIQSFFFLAVVYSAIRFPIFALHGDYKDLDKPKSKKYAKSSLNNESSVDLWQQINEVITQEKIYMNPEYRLNDLAARVGASLHHVSQVINEKQSMSYSDFINHFRIQEAQKMLLSSDYSSFTILAIAFEVGFNSKTAFYNAFKKQTGFTPSQFRKKNQL